MNTESIDLTPFSLSRLPALVDFLNRVLAGHRHWAPITPADFTERVLTQPGFDPAGLILAVVDGRVVGGTHAIKPIQLVPTYSNSEQRHHIAWLAVDPAYRREDLGSRLLNAAEDYLYYCPAYFAAQNAPFYGIIEKLWVPWYGSTERMGVSAAKDGDLVAWLGRRGYGVIDAGDVSMVASLHESRAPARARSGRPRLADLADQPSVPLGGRRAAQSPARLGVQRRPRVWRTGGRRRDACGRQRGLVPLA